MVASLRMKNENYTSIEQSRIHSSFLILHLTYIAACGVVLQARANKRTKKMASELA